MVGEIVLGILLPKAPQKTAGERAGCVHAWSALFVWADSTNANGKYLNKKMIKLQKTKLEFIVYHPEPRQMRWYGMLAYLLL